jgi:hypothetical protein
MNTVHDIATRIRPRNHPSGSFLFYDAHRRLAISRFLKL